jgi:hypothetical protein
MIKYYEFKRINMDNHSLRRKNITQCTSGCYILIQMTLCALLTISLVLWDIIVFYILIGICALLIFMPPIIAWCINRLDLLDYLYEIIP